jgi:hypothetical protein
MGLCLKLIRWIRRWRLLWWRRKIRLVWRFKKIKWRIIDYKKYKKFKFRKILLIKKEDLLN